MTALLSLALAQTATAIPADPEAKKVRQPDGTLLTVQIRGDERAHILLSEDGLPLYYNTKSSTFEYATLAAKGIKGSGIAAKNVVDRTAADKAYIANMDVTALKKAVFDSSTSRLKVAALNQGTPPKRKMLINDFPTTGSPKTLVILWEFSDKNFESVENPLQFFSDMLNKEGFTYSNGAEGSAFDFYKTSSNGMFTPQFVVKGPVKLAKPATYYGSDEGGQDNKIYEAIMESCQALDDEIDFSEYDTDGDGDVDNIYFFYAGNGQADTPDGTEYIWPHSFYLDYYGENKNNGWGKNLVLDGKRINRYTCSNEVRYSSVGDVVPTGIGTFVHEFGHVLGLADHYDTSYGMFTFGLGSWDTMASGSYNNNMNTPPVFSGFERAELGWMQYEDLTLDADSISLLPNLADCNKAYRIKVDGTDDKEFFVLENRQKTGWDKYLPNHGMLLWHIDLDEEAWKNNRVNVDPAHQRVDIVEADGEASESSRAGDIFPGTANVTRYDIKSWAGQSIMKIDDVEEREDTVRLLMANSKFVLPAPAEIQESEVEDSSFVVTWSKVEDAKLYKLSIYTTSADGQKTFLSGYDGLQYNNVESVKVEGLVPDTKYTVEVVAGIGSYLSASKAKDVTTKDLIFEKRLPVNLAASDVNEHGFKASWDEVRDADDYLVTLYKHAYSTATTDKGYDFTDKYDGLPELWNTSSDLYYSVKGYYGEAAPSLRLSSEGDYLIVAYPEAKIDKLTFWCRSKAEGNNILVEAYDGNEWKEAETLAASTTGGKLSVSLDGAEKVRLTFNKSASFVVIDDVTASCRVIERTLVENFDGVSTEGQASFVFSKLTPGTTYSFRVQGKQGDLLSYISQECAVTLPSTTAITGIETEPESSKTEAYDLSGRKVSENGMAHGIYIIKKGGKTVKVLK